MQSKHKQTKQIVNIVDENLTDNSYFSVGITILNHRII